MLLDTAKLIASSLIKQEAADWERSGTLDFRLIRALAENNILGASVSRAYGGSFESFETLGQLCSILGAQSSSIRNLLTVHYMTSKAVERWGSPEAKNEFLPHLCSGSQLGAFALTESQSGSDFDRISTTIEPAEPNSLIVSGEKTWISIGTIADVFLVFGIFDGLHSAVLVPKSASGVTISPVRSALLGARASHLASVQFDSVRVPRSFLVGPKGFGKSAVSAYCLDLGRFTIAWGCLGMAEAVLSQLAVRLRTVDRFGSKLAEQPLIRREFGRMGLKVQEAAFHCERAAQLLELKSPDALMANCYAKYCASKALSLVSRTSARLSGAEGVLEDSLIGRAYRDAPIMEIIEGPSEIHESMIGEEMLRQYGK